MKELALALCAATGRWLRRVARASLLAIAAGVAWLVADTAPFQVVVERHGFKDETVEITSDRDREVQVRLRARPAAAPKEKHEKPPSELKDVFEDS